MFLSCVHIGGRELQVLDNSISVHFNLSIITQTELTEPRSYQLLLNCMQYFLKLKISILVLNTLLGNTGERQLIWRKERDFFREGTTIQNRYTHSQKTWVDSKYDCLSWTWSTALTYKKLSWLEPIKGWRKPWDEFIIVQRVRVYNYIAGICAVFSLTDRSTLKHYPQENSLWKRYFGTRNILIWVRSME